MSNTTIRVEKLSKEYPIGLRKRGHSTLRDHVADRVRSLFHRNKRQGMETNAGGLREPEGRFFALKDVSFEVKQGETVGIIGRNGAGKSTLLKVLSRITEPTSGSVDICGRIGSLLEVGTGFHPELSGRENIYLNGAILGMKNVEIAETFNEIVAFSEIERFIDVPVKHYSSGMYVRLAFSVAAHLNPEILVVDEVLAVGDAAFQKKCLGRLGAVAREGRTVLFVSHQLGAIQALCDRAIWLDSGQVRADGPCGTVLDEYWAEIQGGSTFSGIASRDGNLVITKVLTLGENGQEKTTFLTGERLKVELEYRCTEKFSGAVIYIGLAGKDNMFFAANMGLDGCRLTRTGEVGKVSATFLGLPLAPKQDYYLRIGGRESDNRTPLFNGSTVDIGKIHIGGTAWEIGLKGEISEMLIGNSASILVPYEWDLGNGQVYRTGNFKNSNLG